MQMSILAVFAYSARERKRTLLCNRRELRKSMCNSVTLLILASLTASKERFPRGNEYFRVWRQNSHNRCLVQRS